MAANGKTAMGLVRCPWCLVDEPGSHEINGGSLTWDAIRTAMGKPMSPLRAVLVGTLAPLATGPGHWFYDLVNAGSGPGVHVVAIRGKAKRWDRQSEIRRCNPLAWRFPESRAVLLEERDKARTDGAAAGRVHQLQVEPADRRRVDGAPPAG